MHAHQYRTPEGLEGKNVLVLGIGNSAMDIACETSRVSDMTFLAARRGAWILPKYVGSTPTDELGRPVGDMYTGAMVPGLMLAGLYAAFAFIVTTIWPHAAPGLPPEAIIHREPDGSRGYTSLVVLLALCGSAGSW